MRFRRGFVAVAGTFALTSLFASTASAQDVNVGAGASGSASTSTTPSATASSTAPAATPAATAAPTATAVAVADKAEDTGIDHENMVGHFAVGYLGVTQVPIADQPATLTGPLAGVTRANSSAPVIGVRYWVSRLLGIDGGVGFGWAFGGRDVTNGPTTTSVDNPSRLAFAVHAGVPLALSSGKHYSFEVIPEANFGVASGTVKAIAPGQPDTNLSGLMFDVGARAGAEIYFGFIGIPQLSLQGSVGLYFRHEQFKASRDASALAPIATSASSNTNTVATSVNADPWALFVNNISAFYYF